MSIAPDIKDFTKEEIKDTLKEIRHPFEVAVFNSENYFNMAAILRVGHSFLCKKYYMVDFDKFYKKATMGTHKWEEIEKTSLTEFLETTKDRNIVVFEKRADLDSVSLYGFKYPDDPILFFGSEKFGVPDEVIKVAKSIVTIPLYGIHNDLNVAIAAGIAMNDFVAKFHGLNGKE